MNHSQPTSLKTVLRKSLALTLTLAVAVPAFNPGAAFAIGKFPEPKAEPKKPKTPTAPPSPQPEQPSQPPVEEGTGGRQPDETPPTPPSGPAPVEPSEPVEPAPDPVPNPPNSIDEPVDLPVDSPETPNETPPETPDDVPVETETPSTCPTAENGQKTLEELALERLLDLGFKCEELEFNLMCVGQFGSYSKRVAVLVPYCLNILDEATVHFHGFEAKSGARLAEIKTHDIFWEDLHSFQYDRAFRDLGHEIVLIPESSGRNDDHITYFSQEGAFSLWMNEWTDFWRSLNPTEGQERVDIVKITLQGHSGAFMPIGKIIHQANEAKNEPSLLSHISEVRLFDATYASPMNPYSDTRPLYDWLLGSPSHRLEIHYVEGFSTEKPALDFASITWRKLESGQLQLRSYSARECVDRSYYDLLPTSYQNRHMWLLLDRMNPHGCGL